MQIVKKRYFLNSNFKILLVGAVLLLIGEWGGGTSAGARPLRPSLCVRSQQQKSRIFKYGVVPRWSHSSIILILEARNWKCSTLSLLTWHHQEYNCFHPCVQFDSSGNSLKLFFSAPDCIFSASDSPQDHSICCFWTIPATNQVGQFPMISPEVAY